MTDKAYTILAVLSRNPQRIRLIAVINLLQVAVDTLFDEITISHYAGRNVFLFDKTFHDSQAFSCAVWYMAKVCNLC